MELTVPLKDAPGSRNKKEQENKSPNRQLINSLLLDNRVVESETTKVGDMSDYEEEYDYLSQDDEEDFYSEHEAGQEKESVKTATFDIPDAGYKIVDYKEIYPMMESLIMEISSLLDVDRDITQLLLQKFKWNKERLVNGYYSDPEAVLVSAGVTPNASDLKIPPSTNKCRICFEENSSLIALQCGHGFCQSCYAQYLQVNVGTIFGFAGAVRAVVASFFCRSDQSI